MRDETRKLGLCSEGSAKRTSSFTGASLLRGRPFWIVDGIAYDFSGWMDLHPGGSLFFGWTQGRDISILFHISHRNPDRLRTILDKYRIKDETITERDVLPAMGFPPALLPPGFDARDLPKYDFNRKNDLLGAIHRKVEERFPGNAIRKYDYAFDVVTLFFTAIYLLAMANLVTGSWKPFLCIGILVLARTSLAGSGHSYLHRRQPCPGAALFDLSYLATSLLGLDGHVLLHHPQLKTGGDAKATFFDGMLCLHPLLRIVGYSLHKFGACLLGMPLRGWETLLERDRNTAPGKIFWFIRLLLAAEFFACLVSGHAIAWAVQFLLTLWYNTFLVVSSHDFEGSEVRSPLRDLPPGMRNDWAARQIAQSYDLSIVGSKYIDVFLSAGLSPHRVHHVLPTQRSAFANVVSETPVREACREFGIPWERNRNLLLERFPSVAKRFLLSPAKRGAAHPSTARFSWLRELRVAFHFIVAGWRGRIRLIFPGESTPGE